MASPGVRIDSMVGSMSEIVRISLLVASAATLAACSAAGLPSCRPHGLPKLRVEGKHLVDTGGNPVQLRGVNLGNWLLIEMWMLGLDADQAGAEDQHALLELLKDRFGKDRAHRLMGAYRESWIVESDFEIIRSFGMNVVRLPIDYRLLEDDDNPKRLRPDAWKWIDRAVDLAERHGLYTILDMHGAQGGQSVFDHTGRSGQNKLWAVQENQDRLVWLWREIARRYRDRSAVVAYDLLNEPYGSTAPQLTALMDRLVREVREEDPDKLIYVPGHYWGIGFYGNPSHRGWRNVGFTEHHYPGLFGGGDPTLQTHARFLRNLELRAQRIDELGAPYLVGEMNVVFRSAGGGATMRRYFDAHARFGWATTMWSYRAVSREGGHGDATWGMVANRAPARKIDFRTASFEEVERYFRGFADEERLVYEDLKAMLTAADPELPPLPEVPPVVRSTPHQDRLEGWTVSDVNGSRPGGLRRIDGREFELFGGGDDIWGRGDQFRFLYQRVEGDFDLEVEVVGISDLGPYVKSGLMVRAASPSPSAPSASDPALLLSVFPSGGIQIAERGRAGGEMTGSEVLDESVPIRLRVTRRGDVFELAIGRDDKWRSLGGRTLPALGGPVWAGVVALSHNNDELATVRYRDLSLVRR